MTTKSPNSINIQYCLDSEPELFIEEHAKNIEGFFRTGLSKRITDVILKWDSVGVRYIRPLSIQRFSRVVQGSKDLQEAILKINSTSTSDIREVA